MRRFSQAISEGDGISVIPVLEGSVGELAPLAEAAGAEALAVEAGDVEGARSRTALPIVARDGDPESVAAGGADACIFTYHARSDDERLAELIEVALALGLDCAVGVRDEEELERVLERVDPDIVVISERELGEGEAELERTLDLLADVPAGKLVVSEARVFSPEQVVALERAGVDAVLVHGLGPAGAEFAALLEELVRGSGAHH